MKIFIDFDDVLFNTKKFRKRLIGAFEKVGIPEKEYEFFRKKYYSEASFEGKACYDVYDHIDTLKKEKSFDSSLLIKEIKNLLNDLSEMTFKDSEIFLEKFSKEKLVLITFGSKRFQKLKIISSGIYDSFGNVIITQGDKAEEIRKNIGDDLKEKVFFVDDRVEYFKEAKQKIPQLKTILMKRSEGRYDDKPNEYCDFVAKNLEEVQDILTR